jgi:hypothetical protein
MSDSSNVQPSDAEARHRRWTEFAATVLLAFGSAVTSWSAYQGSLWSGIQATNYNQATARRVESTREATIAGQFGGLDVAMFMGWVNAYISGNERLQQFYRARFRPEFRQAFETWLGTDPMTNPQAPASPFVLPSYRSEHLKHAIELEKEAEALFQAGHRANHYADTYVQGTVVLAIVLFFCGITQQFQYFRTRVVLLGLSTLLLVYGLSRVLVLPRA